LSREEKMDHLPVTSPQGVWSNSLARFLIISATALLFGLLLFYWTMQPPIKDLALMIELMGATTLFSVVATYLAFRAGWINRSPRLYLTLLGGYVLAGVLVFINVWVIAKMMFASSHDLALATILLIFATCMAVAVGFFLSENVIARIQQMQQAARQVAGGKLNTRLVVNGRDEMAQLAEAFNEMVIQLDDADQKKHELDVLRRDLIAWVGHDLRTPLTSIRAIVEALADGLVEDKDQHISYLRTAQADIRALSSLIDDLFEMAQMDAGGLKLEKVDVSIADLVSDTLEQFSVQAQQAGIRLEGSADAGAAPVTIDVQRIGRVLSNLVSNAIRHTPSGGAVIITAQRLNHDLRISVTDTGEGIPAEDIPYVFERFYRGEKSRSRMTGGAGLGLAIAKGIIELHDGRIGVNSQPHEGAEFWFLLPQ
jgi:signal transduction histidine kinase